ncbi:MAG: hypothetical protein AAF623_12620 [Planctomycetota bacterium]
MNLQSAQSSDRNVQGWFASQIGWVSYLFLSVGVICQLATVLITWQVWQVREVQTALPWIEGTPEVSFGPWILGSLVLVMVSPRKYGTLIHVSVLMVAMAFDQFRCQPQIISTTVLLIACSWPRWRSLCLWYLITMWFWAGTHKALSTEWFGFESYRILKELASIQTLARQNFDPDRWNYSFALTVAIFEIGHALLAWFRPKLAILSCVVMHLSIVILLVSIQWNISVLPWNIATAVIGSWLMYDAGIHGGALRIPTAVWQKLALLFLLLFPVGFYAGWVRHSFAHVLYSGNAPQANWIQSEKPELAQPVLGWGELRVPFPREKKAFLDFLSINGKPGDKMSIRDPRFKTRAYYELNRKKEVVELDATEFFSVNQAGISGNAIQSDDVLLRLTRAKVRLVARVMYGPVYAIEFNPDTFQPSQLEWLQGLPNLEQIQLSGCNIKDADLKRIPDLPILSGIGLDQTQLSRTAIRELRRFPNLNLIQFEGRVYGSIDEVLEISNASNSGGPVSDR